MRKALLLFGVLLISLFTIISCNNNESGDKSKTADTTKTDTSTNTASATDTAKTLAPPIDISFYQLPAGMGLKMKKWNHECQGSKCYTPTYTNEIPGVFDAIKGYYKNWDCTITETVNARFKDQEDADFYCKINHISPDSEKGKVKNYKVWLYHVVCTNGSKSPLTTTDAYYEFVSICPPPNDNSCNVGTTKDNSAAKKDSTSGLKKTK